MFSNRIANERNILREGIIEANWFLWLWKLSRWSAEMWNFIQWARYWFTAKWPLFSLCLSVCLCRVFLSRLWSDFGQTRTHVICLGL